MPTVARPKRARVAVLALMALAWAAQGCGFVSIRMPAQYKNKKLVADNEPYTGPPPEPYAPPASGDQP